MSQTHSRRYYVPEYLDLSALLPNYGYKCTPKLERQLHHIVSAIIEATRHRGAPSGFFVPLYSQELKRELGNSYRQAIQLLCSLGILQENAHYSTGKFPKSYRLCDVYGKMPVREVQQTTRQKKIRPDSSVLSNPTLRYIHHNIGLLGLDHHLMENSRIRSELPLERARKFEMALRRFDAGFFDVRQGKDVDRTYSIIVECPREFRRFLTFNGKKLVEGDIQAAFPTLLLSLYDRGDAEAVSYKAALDTDIYTVADMPREKAKKDFQTFTAGNHRKTNRLAVAYRNRFPCLYEKVSSVQGNVLSRFLQDMESDIMNNTIVSKCADMGLFIIPIHDGFMSTAEGAITIAHLIREEFWKRFAFRPLITTSSYETSQEAQLVAT